MKYFSNPKNMVMSAHLSKLKSGGKEGEKQYQDFTTSTLVIDRVFNLYGVDCTDLYECAGFVRMCYLKAGIDFNFTENLYQQYIKSIGKNISDPNMYGYIYRVNFNFGDFFYIGKKKSRVFLGTAYLGSGMTGQFRKVVDLHGDNTVTVELLEQVYGSQEDLDNREAYWIDYYDAINNSKYLNISDGHESKTYDYGVASCNLAKMILGDKYEIYNSFRDENYDTMFISKPEGLNYNIVIISQQGRQGNVLRFDSRTRIEHGRNLIPSYLVHKISKWNQENIDTVRRLFTEELNKLR